MGSCLRTALLYAMSLCFIWRLLFHFLFSSSESTYSIIKSALAVLLATDADVSLFHQYLPLELRCLYWKGLHFFSREREKGQTVSGESLNVLWSVLPCRGDSLSAAQRSMQGTLNVGTVNSVELYQGRVRLGLGKGSASRGSGHGMGCPGQWAWP